MPLKPPSTSSPRLPCSLNKPRYSTLLVLVNAANSLTPPTKASEIGENSLAERSSSSLIPFAKFSSTQPPSGGPPLNSEKIARSVDSVARPEVSSLYTFPETPPP